MQRKYKDFFKYTMEVFLVLGGFVTMVAWLISIWHTETFVAPFVLGLEDVNELTITLEQSAMISQYIMTHPNLYAILITVLVSFVVSIPLGKHFADN